MNNFEYKNPVQIVFGRDSIERLKDLLGPDIKVMLVYGGGSIKKNGVYEQIRSSLGPQLVAEFAGVEPNPSYETCLDAIKKYKNSRANFILAVGGGSVVDAVKFIAAGINYTGDLWEIIETGGAKINSAVKFAVVLTLPATGSEMNSASVISRKSSQEKRPFRSPHVYPQFSILDPVTTFTLPLRQTINGIIDAYVHVLEQYITYSVNSPLQDRQAESVLRTLIEEGPKVLKDPANYEARANIMWSATCALNGHLSCGTVSDWATHMIGHELTALKNIDHGATLAIIWPGLAAYRLKDKQAKLAEYGRRVFKLGAASEEELAKSAITATENFFRSLGGKTRLGEYGLTADICTEISERMLTKKIGEGAAIDSKGIKELLELRV